MPPEALQRKIIVLDPSPTENLWTTHVNLKIIMIMISSSFVGCHNQIDGHRYACSLPAVHCFTPPVAVKPALPQSQEFTARPQEHEKKPFSGQKSMDSKESRRIHVKSYHTLRSGSLHRGPGNWFQELGPFKLGPRETRD